MTTHASAGFRRVLILAAIFVLSALAGSKAIVAAPVGGVVHCRVMEAAVSAQFHVRLAIFHYLDPADRASLGALLRKYHGNTIQFQTEGGAWQTATVFRLKTCFGRGLLVFSTSAPPLAARQEILVRFPEEPVK